MAGTKKRNGDPSSSSSSSSDLTLPSSFKIIQVQGDGNCLFRAISLQIYGDETFHNQIRGNCANYIQKVREEGERGGGEVGECTYHIIRASSKH